MKRNTLYKALISAFVIVGGLSANANAADGTINFQGTVTSSACTTIVGAAPAGGTAGSTTTVNLPPVSADTLNALAGTYAGHTAFTIQLTGCQAAGSLNSVRATFSTASPAAGDNTVMGNTAPSGAADVAVAILTAQSAPVHLNGGTLLDPGAALPTAAVGPVTLNYLAAYKSLSTAVTPGPVTGIADYVISYF
ncbi:TPA: fimbrial protein [Raoultella planticola]|jgi:major type 1 subunit fimbrin (pilin)|uniref:fimbrial protein n=1 Tax=Raoultella planticola TaxID=575 RepID=UPI00066C1B72|nr:fimbrial protein [Raoultella planticola]EIY2678802.1 type 1 fimbrial protein [Raoultella planticola]MCQ6499634.1 type 1 fimbrial protein [Raoultella planticola]TQN56799.1 type 1 fimbrial protein [Raoultella planticola]HBC8112716.1 type 1 fimbrial protein [Raoultella planticola]